MTITASPLSLTRRNAAVSASAWFHTTDPGVFVVDYPTGITGPATVEAAGTRAWTIGNRGGQYLAYPSVHQTRHECTWLFEVDLAKTMVPSQQASFYSYAIIAQSANVATPRRINWGIYLDIYNQTHPNYRVLARFARSVDSSTAEASMNGPATTYTAAQVVKFAIIYSNIAPKSGVYIYHGSRANAAAVGAAAPVGTMGGTEVFMLGCCQQLGRWDGVMSDANLDAWFSSGVKPASPAFLYAGGHEITPSIQKIFDSATGAVDLYNYSVFTPAAASGDTTDTGFTSPLVEVPIVIAADCTAGVHDIQLRRTRVGIPARVPALPDAVLYDDGTIPVTVAVTAEAVTIGPDIDCQVPSYPATFDLILSGNYDGAATVVSDDPNLVPASPVTITGGVVVVACTVAADVTGATVTATGPGGDTDACSVTVAEVITGLKIGPSQTLRSGVTSIYLHITGEDGTCTVTASPVVGLSGVPATVTIASGEADLTLAKMSAGTYTITATQGALSDTCTIIVPVGFTAATEYDLVQDIADMVETYGVGYHYDPELLTDTGGDLEDRMFTVRETGVVDGPMIGGKTVTIAVDAYYCNRAPSSDAKALIDYLNCEADAPSYVHALFATGGIVSDFEGAQKITYEIQVSLG